MIAIIDYNAGNTASVQNALNRLGFASVVTANPKEIISADRVIFPGQGRAGMAMQELQKKKLIEVIRNITIPFLGICIGMQLLLDRSEEDDGDCLGIISGEVKKFGSELKVPHIGWNMVEVAHNIPLLQGIPDNRYFYFAHSYVCTVPDNVQFGVTRYGDAFTSVIQKDNFFGVQFHPEKSGDAGAKLLQNFCAL